MSMDPESIQIGNGKEEGVFSEGGLQERDKSDSSSVCLNIRTQWMKSFEISKDMLQFYEIKGR